jgi:hypothetical protein
VTAADDAVRRLDAALAEAGFDDPRPAFRALLRRIRERDPDGFRSATERYEREIVPAVAGGEADPLVAWLGYGLGLAARLGPGHAVAVDKSGRARPLSEGDVPLRATLVLHLPDDGSKALALLRPLAPSEAQRATEELLAG